MKALGPPDIGRVNDEMVEPSEMDKVESLGVRGVQHEERPNPGLQRAVEEVVFAKSAVSFCLEY